MAISIGCHKIMGHSCELIDVLVYVECKES